MAKQTSASNHLYQSEWWARLAAISEKRDKQTSADAPPVQKEQSNFSKTLASLFSPDPGRELISLFVKTN